MRERPVSVALTVAQRSVLELGSRLGQPTRDVDGA